MSWLITDVQVTVEPLSQTQATDTFAREPTIRQEYGTAFNLRAQLTYANRSTQVPTMGGARLSHFSKLTVERAAADTAGWTMRRGDRISAATDDAGNVDDAVQYVQRSIPRAAWFRGVMTTIVLELGDKFPDRAGETVYP